MQMGSKFRVIGYSEKLPGGQYFRGHSRVLIIEEMENIPKVQDAPKFYSHQELEKLIHDAQLTQGR